MASIAIIRKSNNVVETVLVVSDSKFMDRGQEVESKGIEFLKSLTEEQYPEREFEYKQYTAIRKNYPGIGYKWNAVLNSFIPPEPEHKPYDLQQQKEMDGEWKLNENTCRWEFIEVIKK